MKFLISQSYNSDKDGLDKAYGNYFSKFNIELIPITNHKDIKYSNITEFIANQSLFDGVILSGSGDIKLTNYKLPNDVKVNLQNHKSSKFSEERDKIESKLINLALTHDKPLIGICHGMQKINEYFHGNIQPYYHHIKETFSKQGIEHEIAGTDELIGLKTKYSVNQYHDHCILPTDLAEKLKCFAIDTRFKTVEGFYNQTLNIVGIQWHPERKISDDGITTKILNKFI